MKKTILVFSLLLAIVSLPAQSRYFTKTGKITFDATSPKSPEGIDGINKNSTCVLDSKTGDLQFSVLMKGFEFERALMMEHFNENYAESDKFPKTVFKGVIEKNASIDYAKDGVYPVKVTGKLTMHGETKELSAEGKLQVKGGKVAVQADFSLLLLDYKVLIPQLVADKIAKTAKIKVDCLLEPLTK